MITAVLTKTISVYTFDKKSFILYAGTEVQIDTDLGVAWSKSQYGDYPFDIATTEYSSLQ